MRTLRLVALSDDGKSLILASDGPESSEGERFELPIDERLRAAARGDARRLGQIDVDLGNHLPPRVIQARIRSGETPEQVAAASGTSVERIMRFAHPVLQERARVAEQARDARVRLSEGTPTVPLERFMTERLRLLGPDVDPVQWDAYRSDDGAWIATGTWRAGDESGSTRWAFDIPARAVSPLDMATADFAEGTRLVRVAPGVPTGVPVPPTPRSRPVSVLRDPGRPAPFGTESSAADVRGGDDHLDHLGDHLGDVGGPADADEHVRDVSPVDGYPTVTTQEAFLDEIAEHDTVVLGRTPEDGDDEDPRARIPAWEDIVFGVRRHR